MRHGSEMRYDVRLRRQQSSDAYDAARLIANGATAGVGKSATNAQQRDWLESLGQRPELTDAHRAKVAKSLAWLQEHPGYQLSDSYKAMFTSLESACRIAKEAVTTLAERRHENPMSEEDLAKWLAKKKASQSAFRLASIARAEHYRPRADWMTDPTKLPKRPPTRAGE